MTNRIRDPIDLNQTEQGSVKTSSNFTSGEKFALVMGQAGQAVADATGSLASILPGGSAVLSAVSSGVGGVYGYAPGPFGGGSPLLGGGGIGGGFGGGIGGLIGVGGGIGGFGGGLAGVIGSGSSIGTAGGSSDAGFNQQIQLLNIQKQMQQQSMVLGLISAILNIQHQAAQSIIQNIH